MTCRQLLYTENGVSQPPRVGLLQYTILCAVAYCQQVYLYTQYNMRIPTRLSRVFTIYTLYCYNVHNKCLQERCQFWRTPQEKRYPSVQQCGTISGSVFGTFFFEKQLFVLLPRAHESAAKSIVTVAWIEKNYWRSDVFVKSKQNGYTTTVT